MRELVRGTLAIAFDFTQVITGVMSVRLRYPANVLTGLIAEQLLLAKFKSQAKDLSESLRKIIAPGGLEQIFVPNLEWGDFFQVGIEPLSRKGKSRFLFAERT